MKLKLLLIITVILLSCKDTKKNNKDNFEIDEVNTKEVNSKIDTLKLVGWRSHISWRGFSLTSSHSGKINVNSGYIVINQDKRILDGTFSIDMNSLNVVDLKGEKKNEFENHLKGLTKGKEDHFFNVKKYPYGKFNITDNYYEDESNLLEGGLTLKGIENIVEAFPVEFKTEDDKLVLYSKDFDIDRTRWGINYASKTVFDDLKDEAIEDYFRVRIKLYFDYKKGN